MLLRQRVCCSKGASRLFSRPRFFSCSTTSLRATAQHDAGSGMLSMDDLDRSVASGHIDTVIVGFTDANGRLLGKRYDAQYVLDQKDFISHGCDYLLTVDMEMNPGEGFQAANWERGYGDFHLVPDVSSMRVASWLDKTAIVLCDVADRDTHQLLGHAPRTILKKQIERANGMGFGVDCASELEYYIYEDSYRQAHRKGYHALERAGYYREDYHVLQGVRTEGLHSAVRRNLKRAGMVVESSKGEFGIGQHELNVQFSDVLAMADNHVLFKQCFKETAEAMGKSVSFMAKPHAEDAGSGCHIHLNLTHRPTTNADDGGGGVPPRWPNAFSVAAGDDGRQPSLWDDIECTKTFRTFLGGWIRYTPDIMVFLAPTINSYKRYQAGSWAPTGLAWSRDNRTAGFRVVGHGKSLRIENRLAGADCNPYLAFAGSLAAGLAGVEEPVEAGESFKGDAYRATDLPRVPPSLRDARDLFYTSEFARNAFGDDVVDHYAHLYHLEVVAYNNAVTDWEKQRYFEQV